MATEKILSASITNHNASPPVTITAGKGGAGIPQQMEDTAHITSGVTAAGASFYRLNRVRTTVKVKKLEVWLQASGTTITGDWGVYYSNSPNQDGTTAINVAAADTPIDADFFASAYAMAAVVEPTDIIRESAVMTFADMQRELWDAVGLTKDPGGFLDIVFTLTSTAGSAADVCARVTYVD